MLCHESLINHYKTTFVLKRKFNYSLTELDNMLPFEKELFVNLHIQQLQKEADS
jgi:hypothetical protein